MATCILYVFLLNCLISEAENRLYNLQGEKKERERTKTLRDQAIINICPNGPA